jgi:ribonuclease BN (tRNA processing enzyme)
VLAEATTPIAEQNVQPFAARGHLTVDEAAGLATAAGAAVLVLTHMFEENAPEKSVERASVAFNGEVVLARPGVQVGWP